MADASKEAPVPTDPALKPSTTSPAAPADGNPSESSKKGAKKAEAKAKKEAEKLRKQAERDAAAAASASAASEDLAQANYGQLELATPRIEAPQVHLRDLGEEHVGRTVKVRAWIQNARMQGAKMAFVELREEGNWAVQGVVAASQDGQGVSRQMVKWIGGLKLESFVAVEASVKRPLEPVKSCRVSGLELHLSKVYLVASAPEMLGLGLGPASRAVGSLAEEESVEEKAQGMLFLLSCFSCFSSLRFLLLGMRRHFR